MALSDLITWAQMDTFTKFYGRMYDKSLYNLDGIGNGDSVAYHALAAKIYARGGSDLLTGRGKIADGSSPATVTGDGSTTVAVVTGTVAINSIDYVVDGSATFAAATTGGPAGAMFDANGVELQEGEAYGVTIYAVPKDSTSNGATAYSIKGLKAQFGCVSYPTAPAVNCCVLAWVTINHADTVAIASGDIVLSNTIADATGFQDTDVMAALWTTAKTISDSCTAVSTTAAAAVAAKAVAIVPVLDTYVTAATGSNFRTYYYDQGNYLDASFSRLWYKAKNVCLYTKLGQAAIGANANQVTYTDGSNSATVVSTIPFATDVQVIVTTVFNVATVFTVYYTADVKKNYIATPMTIDGTSPIKIADVTNITTDFSATLGYARVGAEVVSYSGILSGIYLNNVIREAFSTAGHAHTAGTEIIPISSTTTTITSGTASGTTRALSISTTDIVNVTGTHGAAISATGTVILRNI